MVLWAALLSLLCLLLVVFCLVYLRSGLRIIGLRLRLSGCFCLLYLPIYFFLAYSIVLSTDSVWTDRVWSCGTATYRWACVEYLHVYSFLSNATKVITGGRVHFSSRSLPSTGVVGVHTLHFTYLLTYICRVRANGRMLNLYLVVCFFFHYSNFFTPDSGV
ncbi:hypothetical protein FN846DRAFT_955335 [Sphaerosporella brunnea]|uniref:Uncharacterized protein n=1 Tax=Sphaerosporella brunnea TaxID=1250544 RepID=A0A5J5ESG8_9PEZI|nr:hypothetical protein FN846DRAFT_955335 [Sphaerosporella brunnea]